MIYVSIPGSQKHTSGPNGEVTRIVIHATVSPCVKGGARNVAKYFQSDNAGGLAHFVVDPLESVQCCPEDVACWHAPPNHGSIGVELCDPQSGDGARWSDPNHEAMLALAAKLVADLCKRHSVPVTRLSSADLVAGKHGITGHVDVSHAFHQSDHSDPGAAFPWTHFINLVSKASQAAQPHVAPVAPKPAAPVPPKVYPTLRVGSTGAPVKHLQALLHVTADGQFGAVTGAAVRRFQTAHHLTCDGVAGPVTLHALGF